MPGLITIQVSEHSQSSGVSFSWASGGGKHLMKTKICLIAVVATILFGLVGWTVYAQRPQRTTQTTWEYRVIYVPGVRNMSEKAMNELGAQGWELVTYQAINNEGGTIGAGNYFFKRARAGQP
jgi:hypothetical protein